MADYAPSPEYRDSGPYKLGVLLVNSGTPDSLTGSGVRAFLRGLLRDRRTIELSRAIWCPLLYFIILPLRPRRVLPKYRRVWTPEGSPLLVWSLRLRELLEARLAEDSSTQVAVELGMLYSTPGVSAGLERLRAAGAQRLVVLPLFPQYSGTTTAAAYDQVGTELRNWRFLPELRYINDYHLDPLYLDGLAASVREHRAANPGGEHLLMSFHGIPARYTEDGDPYLRKCEATAAALAERLQLGTEDWSVSFQSRVGFDRWLAPYTGDALKSLAARGIRVLDVICPGFAVDCLETVDEIGHEYAELFHAGGGKLRYIPALNASEAQLALLAGLIHRHARQLS